VPFFCAAPHDIWFWKVHGGDFVCGFELAEGEGKAFADAVVVDGEDVRATEAEDEEHLDGPAADATDLNEVLDDGFVGHATDTGEGGYGAVEGFGGQVAEGEGLVVGEAGGTELFVGAIEKVLGGEVFVGGGGVEAFEQAAVNGCCCFAVKLLIDDAFNERFEGGLGAGDAELEGTGVPDEFAQFRVGCGEFAQGLRGVVAGGSRRVERTRHDTDGIAGWARKSCARLVEFGLSWFGFTTPIRFGQGRCCIHFQPMNKHVRDVVLMLTKRVR
jgi:hypothetical protein